MDRPKYVPNDSTGDMFDHRNQAYNQLLDDARNCKNGAKILSDSNGNSSMSCLPNLTLFDSGASKPDPSRSPGR
ncbi:MAG: hypothetical protein IPP57_28470 [Candidatus Obscuribacter sp.]|nr:hypothetical protein [Candidatus Obscuribacter sp.]MBK7838475.1 hypothetical protein [Candidatus Obscuribacter sp.]MBK9201022.1 hypothetical protein [Candidatus Obscuribacter sp.]MBK9621691.1 hypothetical protein [Candidatus Obscuribacter sp.]MBK9774714.1 hypothetical protein [Candidatus Obscuribacter sp.]